MILLIAEHIPDKVRGVLKLWFLEPKPNTFVSSINGKVAQKVVDFVTRHISMESSFLLVTEDKQVADGLKIWSSGETRRMVNRDYGVALVFIDNK